MIKRTRFELGEAEDRAHILEGLKVAQENIDKVYVPICSTLPYVKPQEERQFLDNIDKWGCRGTGHQKNDFDILKYSSKYCEMDCTV